MAKKIFLFNLVFCHLLINSIMVFHFMADFSSHSSEGFHLHADEQLYFGILDSVETAEQKKTQAVTGEIQSEDLADEAGVTLAAETELLPVQSIQSDHDDNDHFHLQLSYLASVDYALAIPVGAEYQIHYATWLDAIPVPLNRPPIS